MPAWVIKILISLAIKLIGGWLEKQGPGLKKSWLDLADGLGSKGLTTRKCHTRICRRRKEFDRAKGKAQ